MRLPNAVHESGPWRIRGIAPDFTLEDVWALPAHGTAEDFPTLLDIVVSSDPTGSTSVPTRVLWGARDLLGRWFGLGRISTDARPASRSMVSASDEASLAPRLPDELRGSAAGLQFRSLPFTPLYRTDDEFAAELSNPTVHALVHLAWVDDGHGNFHGQMAVYVKPRGRLGNTYMVLIRPFRHLIVYPALMRGIDRAWRARTANRGEIPASTDSPERR